MKEFLKKTIKRMVFISGFNQEKELIDMGGTVALSELLHMLEKEHKKFPNIPDSKKQELINDQIIIEDKASREPYGEKFKGLTSGLINRALYPYQCSLSSQSKREDTTIGDGLIEDAKQAAIKRLAEKRKINPAYNPEKEMVRIRQEIGKLGPVRPKGVGTILKESLEK